MAKYSDDSKSSESLKRKGIADIISNPVLVDATGFEATANLKMLIERAFWSIDPVGVKAGVKKLTIS